MSGLAIFCASNEKTFRKRKELPHLKKKFSETKLAPRVAGSRLFRLLRRTSVVIKMAPGSWNNSVSDHLHRVALKHTRVLQ